MRNLFGRIFAVLTVVGLGLLSVPAQTQVVPAGPFQQPKPVVFTQGAISTVGGVVVDYIGTGCGTVAVDASTGDLTFQQGVCGSLAASTEFECPVSAPLGGVIDVSDTACDTFGEVANVINASTSWRILLKDALAADSSKGLTSAGALITRSAVNANGGVLLLLDGTEHLTLGGELYNTASDATSVNGLSNFVRNRIGPNGEFNANPVGDSAFRLVSAVTLENFDSGSCSVNVYSVANSYAPTTRKLTEVATVLATQACATSDSVTTLTVPSNGFWAAPGERLVVRVDASADLDSGTFQAYGERFVK